MSNATDPRTRYSDGDNIGEAKRESPGGNKDGQVELRSALEADGAECKEGSMLVRILYETLDKPRTTSLESERTRT